MRAWAPFLFVLSSLASVAQAQDTGISEDLARERATRVSNVHYDLSFSIPRDKSAPIKGHEVVSFTLSDASSPLSLDFASAPAGHLVYPPSALHAGENRIEIDFDAGTAPLNRNDEFLYTIFVPARAHEAFPCFDQPDLKARWTLSLDVPDGWEALGNGVETSKRSSGGRTRVAFAETQPLPTYLFAFAAGRFSVEAAERNGRAMRMFH